MREKISVIVPAYNCAKYIRRCIDSLLIQTGAEIIVIDDGSRDNLREVLSAYGEKIKLISTENNGVASARNTGLAHANGDFVMFVDADDALEPGCFDYVLKKRRDFDADIVRFGYTLVHPNGQRTLPRNRFEKEELTEKKDFPDKIYINYINGIKLNSVCMTLFKKEILAGLKFRSDMPTAEDAVFSMQAYTRAERVLLLPDAYYLYYQSNEGLTGNRLSVLTKYRCNMILSGEIIHRLPSWGMKAPIWYIKAALRPAVVTLDKLKRSRDNR